MSAVCYWRREPRYHRDVLDNAGPAYRLLHWWQDQCSAAWAAGDRKRLAELRGLTFRVGTHPGMLHLAYEYCRVYGGRAPGLDDVTYEDLAECDPWLVCRKLSAALRSEQYPVDDPRPVWITKPSGGLRLLSLFSIVDRIIGRALASTLTPLIAPGFSPDTFGGLPHRGPPAAFAAAFQIVHEQQAWVWVANDVRKAFDAVPRGRLFNLFARYPAPLVRLIKQLSKTLQPNGKGVCQGGPMSMLLLHVYLHHFHDRLLRAEFPALRPLRYADDLLVPCDSRQQAEEVDAYQRQRLRDAGLQLKFGVDEAISDLNQGGHTDWLGMRVRRGDHYLLDGEIVEEAWISLANKLRRMEVEQVPMKYRRSAVRSWLGYFTLAYRPSARDDVLRRLVSLAKVHGVGGLTTSKLREHWRNAWLGLVEQMHGFVLR
jgi:retron-type reverse transcriptase